MLLDRFHPRSIDLGRPTDFVRARLVGELGRDFIANDFIRALEIAQVDQDADLEEAQHGGVSETELVDISRLTESAIVASIDLFHFSNTFLPDEVVAFLVAAEAEEESRDMVTRVLAILLVVAVHARDL